MQFHVPGLKGPSRTATRLDRRGFAALAALAVLAGSACNPTDATGPGIEEEEEVTDESPTVSNLTVTEDDRTYLRAGLTSEAVDPEGELDVVVIDWGDQSTVTHTSDFDAIKATHDYAEAGKYTVTVTATDVAGNRASKTATLDLEDIPQPCIDIKIISGCVKPHPDFRGVTVEVSVFDVKLNSFTLSTTDNHIELPVVSPVLVGIKPYPYGKLLVDVNFSRTKGESELRFRLVGCTILGNCSATASDQRLTW